MGDVRKVGYNPLAVALDADGNIYIADANNQVIREVVKSTGNIITVAGNGSAGYSGDGGPATSAKLMFPNGVAVDADGNIFITDTFHYVVREVVKSTGNIITVAGTGNYGYAGDGGPATSALLEFPAALAVDATGNLFIADSNAFVIREVEKFTGNIITVAGNGGYGYSGDGGPATSATFRYPYGLAVDAEGNIFIADTSNQVIREVVKETGIIITVAGNGTEGSTGDGGPASSAELDNPHGVAVDLAGNVFIVEATHHRIREVVQSTGNIILVAGNGFPHYGGEGGPATSAEISLSEGVAVDADGNIFIADSQNNVIREVVKSTGKIFNLVGDPSRRGGYSGDGGPATSATISSPSALALDSEGNIFFVDLFNYAIREVVKSTGKIITVAGNGHQGTKGDGGRATSAELHYPSGVAVDSDGNIFISELFTNVIREVVKSTGNIIRYAGNGSLGFDGDGGPATSAYLAYPNGVAVDSAGNLFIAELGNDKIREVVKSTGTIFTVAGDGRKGSTGDGGSATAASLNGPNGVAVDAAGNIFIADTYNHKIREVIKSTGNIVTVAGNGTNGYTGNGGSATSGRLNKPLAVTVGAEGNIYIADSYNYAIREVSGAAFSVTAAGPLNITINSSNSTNTVTLAVEGLNEAVTINGDTTLYPLSALTAININDAGGNDTLTLNIESTAAGIPISVQLGTGQDTVNVSPVGQSLSGILGDLTISAGTAILNLNDQNQIGGNVYSVTDTSLTWTGSLASITYGTGVSAVLNAAIRFTDLSGPSDPSVAWTITGANSGRIANANLSFSGISSIRGGTGDDDFVFVDGAKFDGNINGGAGTNTLDLSAYTTSTVVDMARSRVTSLGGTYSSIQSFIGGSYFRNIIHGPQTSATFNISGIDAINVGGMRFSKFGTLTGGDGNDRFVFSDGAVLTGHIHGGGGTNTIDLTAYASQTNVNLSNFHMTGLESSFSSIQRIFGGSNPANKIIGPDASTVYHITGANAITIGELSFRGFRNLRGGAGDNHFVFADGAALSGSLTGGVGTNTIDLSAYTTTTNVNMPVSRMTGLKGTFSGIQSIIGGSDPSNKMIGPNVSTIYHITGTNAISVGALSLSGFGSLRGGVGNNRFYLADGARLTGSLNGGVGLTWLDYSAYTTPVTVNLASGAATGIGAGIGAISCVKGGSGQNTLTGNNKGNILIGGGANDIITGGRGRNILIGGGGNDTIKGSADIDIVIGGSTTFDNNFTALDAVLHKWRLPNQVVDFQIDRIREGLNYGTAGAVVRLSSTTVTPNGSSTLTGGSGYDWFWKGSNDTITDRRPSDFVN